MLSYKHARRRLAGMINEQLMPRFGVKVVRSRPQSVRYRRLGERDGLSQLRVSAFGQSRDVALRSGTSDWMTFDQIFIDEDYDLRPLARYGELHGMYESMVREGKTPLIVDLGANVGFSALYFSLVWPKAQVVAVEPDPENFDLLQRNVASVATINALWGAAASSSGTVSIKDPKADKNAIRTTSAPTGIGIDVAAVTMPQLLAEQAGPAAVPFIVKIDIEGGEGELFAGNLDWVDAFPLIIIELHDWLYPGERTSRNFLRAISERDRDFVYLDENVFSICNSRSAALVEG